MCYLSLELKPGFIITHKYACSTAIATHGVPLYSYYKHEVAHQITLTVHIGESGCSPSAVPQVPAISTPHPYAPPPSLAAAQSFAAAYPNGTPPQASVILTPTLCAQPPAGLQNSNGLQGSLVHLIITPDLERASGHSEEGATPVTNSTTTVPGTPGPSRVTAQRDVEGTEVKQIFTPIPTNPSTRPRTPESPLSTRTSSEVSLTTPTPPPRTDSALPGPASPQFDDDEIEALLNFRPRVPTPFQLAEDPIPLEIQNIVKELEQFGDHESNED